jgi:flagellar M-ring protein FliF
LADFLKKTFQKIVERFKSLSSGQKTRLVVLVMLVAAIIVTASVFLNRKSYGVLYSGMEAADAGEVIGLLNEMGVDAKSQGTDTILVESSKVDSVRMELAAEGYPKSGYDFDIFAMASGLGTTDVEKSVYLQFQLQENLRQSILSFSEVEEAVVNLSLAQEDAFVLSHDEIPATASVILTLREGTVLTNAKARTIAEVLTSIRGLKVENIRIMDSQMNLYDLTEEEDDYTVVADRLSLKGAVQDGLKEQVVNLLTPIFGQDGIYAAVNATLAFDDETQESTVFNPPVEGMDEGLVVSLQELAETVKGDAATNEVTGTESNGTGVSSYPDVTTDENTVYGKTTREANYELNEIKTQITRAKGYISDLSVSVILDSSVLEEDYTENVRNLVANAIGVDIGRITVERLPFLRLDTSTDVSAALEAQKEMLAATTQAQLIKTLITAGTVIIVFLLLLAALRTLKRPIKPAKEEEPAAPDWGQGDGGYYAPVYYDEYQDPAYGEDYVSAVAQPEVKEEKPASVPSGAKLDLSVGEKDELKANEKGDKAGADNKKDTVEKSDKKEPDKKSEKENAEEEDEEEEIDEKGVKRVKKTKRLWGKAKKMAAKEAEEAAIAEAAQAEAPATGAAAAESTPEILLPEIEIKKDTNLTQLENFIEKNPETVALLLRSWISDER